MVIYYQNLDLNVGIKAFWYTKNIFRLFIVSCIKSTSKAARWLETKYDVRTQTGHGCHDGGFHLQVSNNIKVAKYNIRT